MLDATFTVEKVKHVRTPAGAKKYGLPIGAPITAEAMANRAAGLAIDGTELIRSGNTQREPGVKRIKRKRPPKKTIPSSTRWGATISTGGKPIREASNAMEHWRTPIDARKVNIPNGLVLRKHQQGGKIGTSFHRGSQTIGIAHWNGTQWVIRDSSGATMRPSNRLVSMQSVVDYMAKQ